MRIAEVLAIKWEHIRGDFEQIFVPKTKNRKKRHVPIHPELRLILMEQTRACAYVVQCRGRKVNSIRKGFIAAREKANLPWVWIHDLRHRAITRWVQMGHQTSAIMKATGHRTYSSFQRYANLKDGDVMTLVGKKTEPFPVVTYAEFVGFGRKNVEKTWKAA
jgi:integrase